MGIMVFARFWGDFRYGQKAVCPFLGYFSLWAKGI